MTSTASSASAMPLILTVLTLAAALLVLAFVLAPLLVGQRAPLVVDEVRLAESTDALHDQREAALEGLAELDFDRDLGNLSEADYQNLRAQYRTQAVAVLSTLDAQSVGPGIAQGGQHRLRSRRSEQVLPLQVGVPTVSHLSPTKSPDIRRQRAALTGVISVAVLVAAGLGSASYLSRPASTDQDAPALDILHAHAALLVPNSRVALIAHHGGVLRSVDEGSTWQPVSGLTSEVVALAGAPIAGAPLYLAGSGKIMRSSDEGLTWTALPQPASEGDVQALALGVGGVGGPSPLYASLAGVGLFRANNVNSWEWKLVGGGLPEDVTSMLSRSGPSMSLYASSPTVGVLASGDEGRTWGSASGVLNGTLPTSAVRGLAFDPESGDQFTAPDMTVLSGALYAATDRGLFKSIDAGSSWSPLPLQQPLAAVAARSVPGPLMLAVDSRGRVWRSRDHGGTWSAKP